MTHPPTCLADADPVDAYTPASVRDVTAWALAMTPAEIRSRDRSRRVVEARHVGIFFARRLTDAPLSEIAEAFGLRDHSTVLNAIRRVNDLVKVSDPRMTRLVARAEAALHPAETIIAEPHAH